MSIKIQRREGETKVKKKEKSWATFPKNKRLLMKGGEEILHPGKSEDGEGKSPINTCTGGTEHSTVALGKR